jgi:ribosomal protein S18 acetylase RimI-like enzyme
MREITSHPELVRACSDDPLTVWAAQGLAARRAGRSRAWTDDAGCVVVAAPDLSRRDRLAVHAAPDAPFDSVTALVRGVLTEVGPTFRPLGDPSLIAALTEAVPGLAVAGTFSWMDRTADGPAAPTDPAANPATGPAAGPGGPVWLAADPATEAEVGALLDLAFPDSYARPGDPGVDRWAGLRAPDGTLLAVAALAWSAPGIALLAGVAAHPEARGRGLAARVCEFAVREALTAHGRVGLMVDDWNTSAVRLYRRLGLTRRAVAAAAFS